MCGDVEKLIMRRNSHDEQPVYYAIMEDKYDIISRGHITTDHGGHDRMLNTFVKSIPTARQKLLNSTSPTTLCVIRNENIQEPQVLLGTLVDTSMYLMSAFALSAELLALWIPWLVMNHYELRIKDTKNPCPWMYCPMT